VGNDGCLEMARECEHTTAKGDAEERRYPAREPVREDGGAAAPVAQVAECDSRHAAVKPEDSRSKAEARCDQSAVWADRDRTVVRARGPWRESVQDLPPHSAGADEEVPAAHGGNLFVTRPGEGTVVRARYWCPHGRDQMYGSVVVDAELPARRGPLDEVGELVPVRRPEGAFRERERAAFNGLGAVEVGGLSDPERPFDPCVEKVPARLNVGARAGHPRDEGAVRRHCGAPAAGF